ncbi:MAG: TIGR03084 family protein [Acidimicrobiales bacterium]|nr:TIGR03084 family protein [Acidimicrobiales bacterium]
MTDLAALLDDLAAEGRALEDIVGSLSPQQWEAPTPAPGWTVATQVAHLAWTDDVATIAATDESAFGQIIEAAMANVDGFVDDGAFDLARLDTAELLDRWRSGRARLTEALAAVPEGRKLPWFGPPMSAASMATARLMETWAHGQDVADAVGASRTSTARLRHIAHIGVRTRDFAFVTNGLDVPGEEFLVSLTGPDGDVWSWGPADAAQRVTGPASDFALLVTRRRHPDDLSLVAVGKDAERWLAIAQCFAGPPGTGRDPGQFG